jgi:hypothetical protein
MDGKQIENSGDKLIPFEEYQSESGKEIKLCHSIAIELACDAHYVMENAKNQSMAVLMPSMQ